MEKSSNIVGEAFTAAILHPGNVLELLYTYTTEAEAHACAYAYCRAATTQAAWGKAGYDNENKAVRIKILHHNVRDKFLPDEHNAGLMLVAGVAGDYTHMAPPTK